MSTIIEKVTKNTDTVSFYTLSDSVYHEGERLSSILSLIEHVRTFGVNNISKSWKFKLISNTTNDDYTDTTPSQTSYDDTTWKDVDVPYDWSRYNDFNENSLVGYQGGFLDCGDAWYRKKLTGILSLLNDLVYVYFDGIYMESDVYVNGHKVITNKWYNPFWFECSTYLNFDDTDEIAIFVRNKAISTRWYSGSGIIRPVYLMGASKVNISLDSIGITYNNLESEYSSNFVTTTVSGNIVNSTVSGATVNLLLMITKDNKIVTQDITPITVSANTTTAFSNDIILNNPSLWTIGDGLYYTMSLKLYLGDTILYEGSIDYGYKWCKFMPDSGFWLNGVNTKLHGVCFHHSIGCLGNEMNYSALERQLDIMQTMGTNAIRTAHNPTSAWTMDICMKKGILVFEELFDCWDKGKNYYDFYRFFNDYYLGVIDFTVIRDVHNPALFMWSIGNEIPFDTDTTTDYNIAVNIITEIHKYDNQHIISWANYRTSNFFIEPLLGALGFNYSENLLSTTHTNNPTFNMYGSETTCCLATRGSYARDDTNYLCSSMDDDILSIGLAAGYAITAYDKDYLGGMFVWHSFDYLGEGNPFNTYPVKSCYFGICDTCGFPKDIYYMYQSRWTTDPMIHILPHWNWDALTTGNVAVWLYSNCASVELFLNGASQGLMAKSTIGGKSLFAYAVDYTPGTLLAKGYDADGNVIATDTIKTAGDPYEIKLTCDKKRINGDTYAFIECNLLDSLGNFCPTSNNEITFLITGGYIKGTDNGWNSDVTSLTSNVRKAFHGKCLCIVQADDSTDYIVVKALASGLQSDYITIERS